MTRFRKMRRQQSRSVRRINLGKQSWERVMIPGPCPPQKRAERAKEQDPKRTILCQGAVGVAGGWSQTAVGYVQKGSWLVCKRTK